MLKGTWCLCDWKWCFQTDEQPPGAPEGNRSVISEQVFKNSDCLKSTHFVVCLFFLIRVYKNLEKKVCLMPSNAIQPMFFKHLLLYKKLLQTYNDLRFLTRCKSSAGATINSPHEYQSPSKLCHEHRATKHNQLPSSHRSDKIKGKFNRSLWWSVNEIKCSVLMIH